MRGLPPSPRHSGEKYLPAQPEGDEGLHLPHRASCLLPSPLFALYRFSLYRFRGLPYNRATLVLPRQLSPDPAARPCTRPIQPRRRTSRPHTRILSVWCGVLLAVRSTYRVARSKSLVAQSKRCVAQSAPGLAHSAPRVAQSKSRLAQSVPRPFWSKTARQNPAPRRFSSSRGLAQSKTHPARCHTLRVWDVPPTSWIRTPDVALPPDALRPCHNITGLW